MLVAVLALFIAMGGSAVAAHHYLVSSTKQISPTVLKKLKGKTGATGAKGANGTPGAPGAPGVAGKNGANLTAETTLPSGQSESGGFSAGGGYDSGKKGEEKEDFGYIGTGITFTQPLAQPIDQEHHIIDVQGPGGSSAPHCPGIGKADPGYLCLYNSTANDVEAGYGYSNTTEFSVPEPGVQLFWEVKGPGEPYVGGEWTVTAP
jgi:hypothetical protein